MIKQTRILGNVGLFATPDDMKALQDYLELFNGSEAMVANTCCYMAWNLCAKITTPPEGYVDVRMTIEEAEHLLFYSLNADSRMVKAKTSEKWQSIVDQLQEVIKEATSNEEDQS